MKISLFLLFLCAFHLMATETEAQNAVISISQNNLSIKQLISEIEKQTDYLVVFRNQDVDVNKVISFNRSSGKVSEYLDEVHRSTNLSYVFENNYITLSNRVDITNQDKKKVTGKVTDQDGEPVIGASVVEKGTTNGVITDVDGFFSLEVKESAIIEISYVGYRTKDVSVAGKNDIQVQLIEDMQLLDEVVVVGFGTQKKVNLTGAVSSVTSEAFEKRSVSNATQALQGAIPGLNIQQTQGYLDATPVMNIRGVGTIGEGSSGGPLVLIDGMEGDMNRLNPQDIESVSVLKDAAASSIYGSRAPFGVILITTKKGKAGKMTVNYNNSLRWSKATNMPRTVDSYSFATYLNEAATNVGMAGHFSAERLQKIKDLRDGKLTGGIDPDPNNPSRWADLYDQGYANTDWINLIFKDNTFSQEHNLNVSGGSEKVQMYASVNYLGQGGYIRVNPESNDRISTNFKVTSKFNDYISLNYNIRFNQVNYEKPAALVDNFFTLLSCQSWPTLIAYDPNGNLYEYATHALRLRDGGQYTKKTNETVQQLNLVIEPIKGWKIIGDVNYQLYHERVHSDWQKVYNHDVNGVPYQAVSAGYSSNTSVSESYVGGKYLNINAYTEYQKELSGHNFKIMGGMQSEQYWKDQMSAGRLGIIVAGTNEIDATSGNDASGKASPPTAGGASNKWATAGFFGRLNYDYKGRYLLEANIRYDGTSRYRSDQRWRWFPSVSLGWNMANEEFFGPLSEYISTFKWRGSYGWLGNQNTKLWYPTYLTMPIGSSNSGWLINGNQLNTSSAPGLISTTMGWETVKTANVGFDANALNNRLGLTLEWFTRKTEDMIGPAPEMPVILGTTVPKTNNTSLRTNGWEVTVSWRDRLKNGLGYKVALNLSDARTKILEYPNNTGTVTNYYSGKNMGEIWGFETVGIAKNQQEMDAHLASLPNGGQTTLGNDWAAGDIMYRDLNGDGKIDWGNSTPEDLGDMKVIGNNTPRYLFGLNLGMDYKGFDINIFFQGVMKRDYFTGSQDFWGAQNLWRTSFYEQHMDYFRNDENHALGVNMDSYYPRPLFDTSKNKHAQTRYLLNASYIRLKNVSIGYTLPKTFVNKCKLQDLRIYITGENLWTGTKLTDLFDPETLTTEPEGMVKYPLSSVYSFGLSITY